MVRGGRRLATGGEPSERHRRLAATEEAPADLQGFARWLLDVNLRAQMDK